MELSTSNIVNDLIRWQNAYLQTCETENLAERSLTIYRKTIDDFVEFSRQFQDEISIKDINLFYISHFFKDKDANAAKPYSASTKKHILTILKIFLKFISENNTDGVDLVYNVRNMKIKVEKKEKPFFPQEEINKVLAYLGKAINSGKWTFTAYRNSLIFKIFYYSGIRAQEMVKMRLSDLVLDEEQEVYRILIQGKGSKERFVYVAQKAIEIELDHLSELLGPNSHIAVTKKCNLMTTPHVYQALERVYRAAGCNKKGLHILRHTLGRKLVDEDVNLETIRDLFGHESIFTTQNFYAKTNEKNKIRAIKRSKGSEEEMR